MRRRSFLAGLAAALAAPFAAAARGTGKRRVLRSRGGIARYSFCENDTAVPLARLTPAGRPGQLAFHGGIVTAFTPPT